MERTANMLRLSAHELMTRHPKTRALPTPAVEAVALVEQYSITSLLIVGADAGPIGVLRVHELLKAGLMDYADTPRTCT